VISQAELLGLKVKTSKCELVFIGAPDPEVVREFNTLCPCIKVADLEDLIILGAPISDKGTRDVLTAKTQNLEKLTGTLKGIDAHYGLFLLKNAFAIPRLLYILRTSVAFRHDDLLLVYGNLLRGSLSDITNVEVDDSQWALANLRVAVGGLGIPSAVKLAPSAFLASAASCDSLSERIFHSSSPVSAADTQAIEKWSELSGETNLPSEPCHQKAWTCKTDDKTLNDLLANTTDSERARFNAYNDKTAAAWLKALPCQKFGAQFEQSPSSHCCGSQLVLSCLSPTHLCTWDERY
jgi:hypothetical protein